MTTDALLAQVKGLEAQLAVLKARLEAIASPSPPSSFADLQGILSGVAETTEEELEAAEYSVEWPEEEGPEE
jgi:hypothetical protein